MMVGREIRFERYAAPAPKKETVLEVENVQALNDRNLPALRGVSFAVAAGEIVGFAGVAGNGQRELAQAITGLRTITGGRIRVEGRDLTNAATRAFIEAGVSYVPADRHGVATVGEMSLSHNSVLRRYREEGFAHGPFMNFKAATDYAHQLIEAYHISTPGTGTPVRNLSGGNLQKVILAREITTQHKLLVIMSATRGLDVGATEFIRNTLDEHRRQGAAIVLISEDLEELLSLSDRIAVLFHGEIMGVLPAAEARIEALGLMMAGQRMEEGAA
jgi:simple sugar transport system ATP-binding protein